MLTHEAFDLAQLILRETAIELQSDGLQPELRLLALARDVHVRWFASVTRVKEEAVRATLENGRTHTQILAGLGVERKT